MPELNFQLPPQQSNIIKVIGVGGGGGNAVNHMFEEGITGVDFYICNTDAQALEASPVVNKIHLGNTLTEGRGAGSNPEVGKKAAEESIDEIIETLGVNTQMVFITAGMGGGTGTGAAPVLAKAAKELGILTVGIVTTPFSFEGSKRAKQAETGIDEMRAHVDSLLVISNDRIKDIYGNLPISKAFSHADDVLTIAAKGIAEIITIAGTINVDFEDVKTAMKDSGVAIMGSGVYEGQDRALKAAEMALNSPLLNDNQIHGASDLLINISYGELEATMEEYSLINEYFQEQAGMDANLKCGLCLDESLAEKISVTVIATGFNKSENVLREEIQATTAETLEFEYPENVDKTVIEDEQDAEDTNLLKRQRTIFDLLNEEPNGMDDDQLYRLKKLRELKKSSEGEDMEELENIPAYKRRGVKLKDVPHSSESNFSKVSLIEEADKKPELRNNNSFLHDHAD